MVELPTFNRVTMVRFHPGGYILSNMELRRYDFSDVFLVNPDGTLSIKRPISVSGVGLDEGVTFGPGAVIGGIDFHKFKYRPIAGEEQDHTLIIRGFYQQ